MEIRKAYKFELMPNGEQSKNMNRFLGCCRFVYNNALKWSITNYKENKNYKFSYVAIANQLIPWKKEFPWLKSCHSQALQQSLKNLEKGFKNFFAKRASFPKFKKKAHGGSFRFPQGFKIEQNNSRIYLPKIGWIRYRNSQDILGIAKNVTVIRECDKWFVSIQVEYEIEPEYSSFSDVGIDMGIIRFATLSTGEFFAPINILKTLLVKLKKLQFSLSHKTKFSNNWQKAKKKISRLHQRIAHIRKDFLHKLSRKISDNQTIVYLEDLQIRNMSKSASGTLDAPGKMVKQKSGLNRSILDQGWYAFRRMLEYKLQWKGGKLILVPPKNTSLTCPECNHISKENRKAQADFLCVRCCYAENADKVGAINILRAGRARLACEVNGAVMPSTAGTHRDDLELLLKI